MALTFTFLLSVRITHRRVDPFQSAQLKDVPFRFRKHGLGIVQADPFVDHTHAQCHATIGREGVRKK